MAPFVSVIIATHSPAPARLDRTLQALARQTYAGDRWELILVDNASAAPVDHALAATAHPQGRVLREPRLGLTHARLAGIAAARGEIIIFVDDDNVLHEAYLATAAGFLQAHPGVAVAGALIRGEYETPPPAWAADHLWSLAVRDYGNQPLVSTFSPAGPGREWPVFCPIGAGMVLRAEAARRYAAHCATSTGTLSDRTGKSLASAGDCELVMHAAFLAGAQVAYVPALQLTHLMPAGRLKFSYLTRLNFQSGISWGQFATHYGFQPRISRASLLLRIPRVFLRRHGWTRHGFVAAAAAAGEFIGRAAP